MRRRPDLGRTGIDPDRIVWIDDALLVLTYLAYAGALFVAAFFGWALRGFIAPY